MKKKLFNITARWYTQGTENHILFFGNEFKINELTEKGVFYKKIYFSEPQKNSPNGLGYLLWEEMEVIKKRSHKRVDDVFCLEVHCWYFGDDLTVCRDKLKKALETEAVEYRMNQIKRAQKLLGVINESFSEDFDQAFLGKTFKMLS